MSVPKPHRVASSTGDPLPTPASNLGTLGSRVDDQDQTRWWTWSALGGVAVAALLAAAGGFPFDMPMPTHSFGWVDPTCGLTRGSTAIARGDLALAWRYNPTSFLVMAFGFVGLVRVATGWTTGRWWNISPRLGAIGWVLVVLAFAALTAYQQTNADFIINSRA